MQQVPHAPSQVHLLPYSTGSDLNAKHLADEIKGSVLTQAQLGSVPFSVLTAIISN